MKTKCHDACIIYRAAAYRHVISNNKEVRKDKEYYFNFANVRDFSNALWRN